MEDTEERSRNVGKEVKCVRCSLIGSSGGKAERTEAEVEMTADLHRFTRETERAGRSHCYCLEELQNPK